MSLLVLGSTLALLVPHGLPYEVREPAGPARGTVLVLHGGGWLRTGRPLRSTEDGEAERLTSYGWTVNADYRPGADSVADAIAWSDWIRRRWDGRLCVFGRSAGATSG